MTSWGMQYNFLGKCQHIPAEEIKIFSCQNKFTFLNQCSELAEIQSENIVGKQRFKPEINWSETVNQNISFEK